MIDKDIQIVDINPLQWCNLFDLLFLPDSSRKIFIIHDQGVVLKTFDSQRGLREDLKRPIIDSSRIAKTIYDSEKVDAVLVLERGAIIDYYAAVQVAAVKAEDPDAYFYRAKKMLEHYPDRLVIYPPAKARLSISYEEAKVFIEQIVTSPSTLLLFVFEKDSIWTSLIIGIKDHKVVLVTTSDSIVPLDYRIEDWRANYRVLIELTEKRYAPVFMGLFMEKETFEQLVKEKEKSSLFLSKLREGSIIVDPLPSQMSNLLGL